MTQPTVSAPVAHEVTIQRSLEVGLRFAPSLSGALPAAKALAAHLDSLEGVSARLAAVGREGSRIHLTLAVTLGTIDDIKVGGDHSRRAVRALHSLIEALPSCEPALVALPDPASPEARLADQVQRTATLPLVVRELAHLS